MLIIDKPTTNNTCTIRYGYTVGIGLGCASAGAGELEGQQNKQR
jgi:hypothetical protein